MYDQSLIVITGGSSGIGRAIVEELCKEGGSIGFTGISDIGASTEAELTKRGHDVLFCQGDMADEAFCERVVERVLERWGKINYLVNNAFSFTAKGLDQFGKDFACDGVQWTASGGEIGADGVFQAGTDEGNYLVNAAVGSVTGSATVSVARKDAPGAG